jgi:hypothetical protein
VEIHTFEPAELVVCTEVAEHLEADHADKLVSVLAGLAQRAIYFSAAPPGQGGTDHVNEQPPEYWIAKLERLGWPLDTARSEQVRAELRTTILWQHWYTNNSMVFTKESARDRAK